MTLRARRPDPIRIVEAAYAWQPDERRWLGEIVDAASSYDVGGGIIAYTVQVGRRAQVGSMWRSEGAAGDAALALERVSESFPAPLAREIFSPTEFVGNAAYRLSRIARARGGDPEALTRSSASRLPDMWALIGGDPALRSLLLCFPRGVGRADASPADPFPHRQARALGLVGAHLSAALRLRALIGLSAGEAAGPRADDAETEAVMTPAGKLLHAQGPVTTGGARASLVQAVLSSERARGRLRRADPDEAIRTWSALVDGRWTILDAIERDGKRLILARRNPLRAPDLLDLSPGERDVAWLAAFGHSYKYIAYELGIPLGTVAGRLRRALRKLRVTSRRELLARLGMPGGAK